MKKNRNTTFIIFLMLNLIGLFLPIFFETYFTDEIRDEVVRTEFAGLAEMSYVVTIQSRSALGLVYGLSLFALVLAPFVTIALSIFIKHEVKKTIFLTVISVFALIGMIWFWSSFELEDTSNYDFRFHGFRYLYYGIWFSTIGYVILRAAWDGRFPK